MTPDTDYCEYFWHGLTDGVFETFRSAFSCYPAAKNPNRPYEIPTDRGQMEPLAALIAVTVVAGAFSLYAGFLTGFVSDLGSDRDVSQGTAQLVWEHLGEDGVYEDGTDIATEIPVAALPQGYQVYVNVTYVDETGRISEKNQALFGTDGTPINNIDPASQGEVFERPIPVQEREGEITPGTLRVVIWDAE